MAKIDNSQDSNIPSLHQRQREFFASGETRPLNFRLATLENLGRVIEKREKEIRNSLSKDLGKPEVEGYISEFYFLLHEIRHTCKNLKRWAKPKRASNPFYYLPARSEIRQEAIGTVLVLSPWNYPFQLSLSPLIAAIAAGNTVILKPSEKAPATADLLKSIVSEVFSPDHAAVVIGEVNEASELLDQPFDFFFFTGAEKVGRLVAAAAAKHLSPAVLELGGKSPCIVDKTADIDIAAERIVSGKFLNAGQTCMAPDFVAAEESIREALIEKLQQQLKDRYGHGREEDLARILDRERFDAISRVVKEPIFAVGEDVSSRLRMAPKLLPEANWNDECMQEEIFGPVLPIVPFQDLEHLQTRLQSHSEALALYVFSRDKDFREAMAQSHPSGTVCFNDVIKQATNVNLPFGGVGASGMGRYRGIAGFQTFTYARSVTKRYFWKDFFTLNPPYDEALERIRKILR